MADRTITARLRLVHSEYTKGLADAAKKTRGLGDASTKAAKRSSDSWIELGRRTSDLGSSLSTRLTIPIIGAGAAALKFAHDFDGAFTQMEATAGVASSEIEGLKSQVLNLAVETGRSPQELAEGLLLVRSSGFAGAEAMAVLRASARGAAAGMGETRDIANALTNVVAGYGADAITAAQAMDILTAAVTEGKAEASDLAPELGRLVPLGAELGIEFSDVAGSMAYMTRATGDASQSATSLQGIMSKLLRPSQQGAEALEEIGIKGDGVRKMLAERGLLGTLETLRGRLGDTGFQLLFDDVQALNGALQMTGPGLEDARQVIENVTDSAGAADMAFSKWANSAGSKAPRAWAAAQAALISFGDQAMPVLAEVAEFVTGLLTAFADLPDGVKDVVIAFAGLLAVIGPVLKVTGSLQTAWGNLSKLSGPSSSFVATSIAAGGLSLALGGVFLALTQLASKQAEAKRQVGELAQALAEGGATARQATDEFLTGGLTAGELGEKMRDAGVDLATFTDDMKNGAEQAKELQDVLQSTAGRDSQAWKRALDDAAESGDRFAEQILKVVDAEGLSREETINLLDTMGELSGKYAAAGEQAETMQFAQDQVAESAEKAGFAIDEQGNIVDATKLAIDELTTSLDALIGRYLSVDESVRRQNELILGLEEHFKTMREEYGANALALDNHTAAGIANSDMLSRLFEATAATTQAMLDNGVSAEELAMQWGSDRGELDLLIQKFREAGQDVSDYDALLGEIDALVQTYIEQPGMTESRGRAVNYRQIMNSIPSSRNTRISITGGAAAAEMAARVRENLLSIPRFRNIEIRQTHRIVGATDTGPQFHGGGMVRGPRGREIAALVLGGEEVLHWDDPRHSANLDRFSAPVTSGAGFGGGGVTNINLDMRGAVVSSEREFRNMVVKAFNTEMRKGRGLMAVRR